MSNKKITELTQYNTPVDADVLPVVDTGNNTTKKITWAYIKSVLKTYFDTLYVALTGNQVVAGIKTFSSFPVTPSSAPTTDYQTANKKYVDDNIVAVPVKATGAEITTGTDDAKFATPKAMADAGVNTRLKSKVKTATRDLTVATGDVAYTGIGFTPTAIIVFASIPAGYGESEGICDSAKAVMSINYQQAGLSTADTTAFCVITTAGGNQSAIVKTLDADGFTLTWTKTSSPTGTASLIFLCLR